MYRMKKLKIKEAGDMIASNPYNPNKELTIIDVIAMELEKLSYNGSILPVMYSQALDLARGQKKVINNIYSRNGRDIKPIIMLLLRQVRNRLKQLFINMKKQLIKEVQQFKKIAGLINENWHPDDPAGVDLDDREEDPDDYDDISEDDYSEDPSSDMDDESQSGDTDAMNINEEGESITIDIPENTDYKELARAVAKVLIDDYGAHNYKPFLQALISELK